VAHLPAAAGKRHTVHKNECDVHVQFFAQDDTNIIEVVIHRGPGFDSRALLRIFLRELGLERGPLSLVIG
jgi:hypothetical protein